MADVFISYAHSTAKQAQGAAAALRALGYSVWLDDDLASQRAYTIAIEEQLVSAKAALVIWSADAAKSEWVLSEANRAREDHKLVQLVIDKTRLPMPFDQVLCADLAGWSGEGEHPNWRKVIASIANLTGGAPAPARPAVEAPLALPTKPSIAVLPFANLSGDPEQEYFADGMVVEIVEALSRIRSIFVIASGSSLTFKGKGIGPGDAARQLGVRYVLEGSVRKAGGRVRIGVQLIDAGEGAQIWAGRFEDTLEDIFALQDKVALSVVGVIEPTVREAEVRHALARPTQNMGAYDLGLRALPLYQAFAKTEMLAALDLFNRAVALDPDNGWAISMALMSHAHIVVNGWSDDPEGHLADIKALTRRALALAGDDPEVLLNAGSAISMTGGDPQAAATLMARAMELNPGSSVVWAAAGFQRFVAGEPERAFEHLETALRLDPLSRYRAVALGGQGAARFMQERFAEAVHLLKQSIQLRPDWGFCYPFLAAGYGHLGDTAAAREAMALYSTTSNVELRASSALWPNVEIRALILAGLDLAEGARR